MAEPDIQLHWICCWPAVETVLKRLLSSTCIALEASGCGRRNYNCIEISLSPGKSVLYITTVSKYIFMDFFFSVLWNINIFEIYSKQVVIYGFLQYQHEFPPPKWNIILYSSQKAIPFLCTFLENHSDVWYTGFQLDQDVLVLY